MVDSGGLFLHEEVLLLALRDREGTIAGGTNYQYAVGGAVLSELLMRGRVGIEEVRRKKFLKLLDGSPIGDEVADECLRKVVKAKRRAVLGTWVSRFAGVKHMRDRIAAGLCRRGILRADEDEILLIFKRKIYPEVNPAPEREIIGRIEEAIFTERSDVDARTAVLVALAKSADVLKVVVDKRRLKERKRRIEQIANGEIVGKATKEAIAAMQAAVMVAVIMPTMMSTISH